MLLVRRKTHVVQMSGGVGSWYTARRLLELGVDPRRIVLLFADTLIEDEDLYRFLDDCERDLGVPITRVSDGRNPWEVFRDVRFIGNTRIDPCSAILKRKLLRKWLDEHCKVDSTICYIGIDWTEAERYEQAKGYWAPYDVRAPLCEPPWIDKDGMLDVLKERGIAAPRLYAAGFPHNNCGGFCVKGGQGQFAMLLENFPERYRWHEEQEEITRQHIGKDVSILRDRRGGLTRPLTLHVLRRRIEDGVEIDRTDIGGCNCVAPDAVADQIVEVLQCSATDPSNPR